MAFLSDAETKAPTTWEALFTEMLAAKADELDRKIRQLAAVREGLRHAAACGAPSHMECPTFNRLLRAAAAGIIQPDEPKVPPKRRKRQARR